MFSFGNMHITLIPPLHSVLTLPLIFYVSFENFELFPQYDTEKCMSVYKEQIGAGGQAGAAAAETQLQ